MNEFGFRSGHSTVHPMVHFLNKITESLNKKKHTIAIFCDLKNALFRVENKTYGICKVTGKLIGKERLKIVPHATMSIEAKNLQR